MCPRMGDYTDFHRLLFPLFRASSLPFFSHLLTFLPSHLLFFLRSSALPRFLSSCFSSPSHLLTFLPSFFPPLFRASSLPVFPHLLTLSPSYLLYIFQIPFHHIQIGVPVGKVELKNGNGFFCIGKGGGIVVHILVVVGQIMVRLG